MMEAIRAGLTASATTKHRDAASPSASQAQPGFGQMVNDVLIDTVNALRTAETTSTAALEGKASIQEVVDAVMQAERQLQTTLAIRDKVVAAYLDITRMQI
jgi:flagellar hook-basal body complex protein FliE